MAIIRPKDELLTMNERYLLEELDAFTKNFQLIVGHEAWRHADLTEASHHLQALRRMILSQAAARAYPESYRLLGGAQP